MADYNFPNIVDNRKNTTFTDVDEWRDCYEGGRHFRDKYLEPFSDRETDAEYLRRRSLTPIPAYARKEINRIKNSLVQRFPDISRRGGSKAWNDAVNGVGRGVDLRGSGMSSFVTKKLIADALVVGKVGTLVDAPRVNGPTAADVPQTFRPYLQMFPWECFGTPVAAPPESPSDWSFVMLKNEFQRVDVHNGSAETVTNYVAYYLDEARGNRVTVQHLDEGGQQAAAPILLNLEAIPFVMVDVLESLMRDVCSYQITLLNMISADSNHTIDANFPTLTRQRGNANAGSHLIGDDKEVETGRNKGLFYDKGMERPGWIAPPTEPMDVSLNFRRELKAEVHELVTGVVAGMSDDGSIESGLSFIGSCLEDAENRIWDHWQAFETTDAKARTSIVVSYPDDWSLKTDEERLKEANDLIDFANKLPVADGKKEAVKAAYDKMFRGKLSTKKIDALHAAVDKADFTTSDPEILKIAAEFMLADKRTLSMALGFKDGLFEIAKEEEAEKAEKIAKAQSDAAGGSAQGLPEMTADPRANKEARKGQADRTADLDLTEKKGVRGDGK